MRAGVSNDSSAQSPSRGHKTNRLARASMIAGVTASILAPVILLQASAVIHDGSVSKTLYQFVTTFFERALATVIVYLMTALAGIAGLCGAIFGHLGLQQIREDFQYQKGIGMARGGMILGYFGLILVIIKFCFVVRTSI